LRLARNGLQVRPVVASAVSGERETLKMGGNGVVGSLVSHFTACTSRPSPTQSTAAAVPWNLRIHPHELPPTNLHLRNLPQTPDSRPCRSCSWCGHCVRTAGNLEGGQPSFSSSVRTPCIHTVFLHARHFQIPVDCLFTVTLPQNVHEYLLCCWISIFFTCLRREAPYLQTSQ